MIKTDLISSVLNQYKIKRLQKERQCEIILENALKDAEFFEVYNKLNGLTIDIAKAEYLNETNTYKSLKTQQEELNNQKEKVLKRLNLSKQDLLPKYDCNICNDLGIVNGKYCECLKKEISLQLLKQSNIDFDDAKFASSSLEIFGNNKKEMQKTYSLMQKFCENFPNCQTKTFVFSGGTGTGKTYLSKCVALNLIEKGNYVFYTTAFNLSNELLKYHISSIDEKNEIIDKFLNCDLLIIDDLGVEPIRKNISIEYLYTIISERNLNNKFTLITTNLSPQDLLNRYGERIYSRISDKSKSAIINFDGEDLRLKRK